MIEIIPELITVVVVGAGVSSSLYVLHQLRGLDDPSWREQYILFLPVVVGMILFLIDTAANAVHTLYPTAFSGYAEQLQDVFLLGEAICFGVFLFRLRKALKPEEPGLTYPYGHHG